MKIGIIGTGALASLFGARLSGVADVALVGSWAAQIEAVRERGIFLLSTDGNISKHKVNIYSDVAKAEPVDIVLVLVKSYQTAAAAEKAAAWLKPDGVAITLQNGLGNLETLQANLGKERVLQGVTTQGAAMVEAGVVRDAGKGEIHVAGEHPLLADFLAMMHEANFDIHQSDQVDSLIWGKLVINTGINPLTAILRVANGYLVENAEAKEQMSAAVGETADIAHALNIKLPYDDPVAQTIAVAKATATNHSSMYSDVKRGAQTEIEAICGEVVRLGKQLGIATPMNASFLQQLS